MFLNLTLFLFFCLYQSLIVFSFEQCTCAIKNLILYIDFLIFNENVRPSVVLFFCLPIFIVLQCYMNFTTSFFASCFPDQLFFLDKYYLTLFFFAFCYCFPWSVCVCCVLIMCDSVVSWFANLKVVRPCCCVYDSLRGST